MGTSATQRTRIGTSAVATIVNAAIDMSQGSAASVLALFLIASAAITGNNTPDPGCDLRATTTRALAELSEASGIAASRRNPNIAWSHNDSASSLLIALDSNGRVAGRAKVSGATPVDWEDLAVGPCPQGSCVYIADIGDNDARRRDIAVHRVSEPAVDASATAAVETFRATYPDGPRDAEAMFVTAAGEIYIASKGQASSAALYRFPQGTRPGSLVQLERVVEFAKKPLNNEERITGGGMSPDNQWVALRTHTSIRLFRAEALLRGSANETAHIDLSPLHEPQGEGVAMTAGNVFLVVGEGGAKSMPGTFAMFTCAAHR